MKAFYLYLLTLVATTAQSQRIEQYYDWKWSRAEPSNARFVAILEKRDSVWERKDYFLRERSQQMGGYYTDTSCKVAVGKFNFFHSNGHLQSTGEYREGKKHGLWLDYYPDGMLKDSTAYDHGNATGVSLAYHQNGYLSDSAVYNSDGSGVRISWFDNGVPSAAGRYAAGYKKQGKWQFFHRNGKISADEVYANDKLMNRQYFDEEGVAITDTTSRDKPALYKGSPEAWQKFILKQLYFPSQYKIVNADQAVVVVDAVIDEEGNMTRVEVNTPFHPQLDRIAVDALRRSPKWNPAIEHNRRVKYAIRQAVTFQQE